MKRRQFLFLTAGGIAVAGAGAGAGLWLFCPDRSEPRNAQSQLAALAESMVGVADVGRAWRAAHGQDDVQARLLESLGLRANQVLMHDELVDRLATRVEQELDQGRIFEHEGWWLSETEARLAALHVALLGPDASTATEPQFDRAPEVQIVELEHFNPRSIRQGETLAHPGLPEGVIWFALAERPPPRLVVMLAGRRVTINPAGSGFSIRISDALMENLNAHPGEHEIWLYDPVANRRQRLGVFTVREAAPNETGFCPVERWGPQETVAGEVFNEQPDGAAAFWIRIGCFPPETVVVFNGVELPTTLRPDDGLITVHVADPTLYAQSGTYQLELLDRETDSIQPVGEFQVTGRP